MAAKVVGPSKGGKEGDRIPVAIRIILSAPPAGVAFGIQGKDQELLQCTRSTGNDVAFDLTILAARTSTGPRFFGDVTQGPPAARFVYVCSGTMAGQPDSCWTRRAKVPLAGITWDMVERARRSALSRLEARLAGAAPDGGPACASVKVLGDGWRLVR